MRYLSEDEATRMMGVWRMLGEVRTRAWTAISIQVGARAWMSLGNPIGGLAGAVPSVKSRPLGGLGALYAATRRGLVYQVQGLADEEAGAEARKAGRTSRRRLELRPRKALWTRRRDGTLSSVRAGGRRGAPRSASKTRPTQMMGVGYLGEVRQGPDGNLYQYVQGVDGLGNPIGACGAISA